MAASSWTPEQLRRLGEARELEIASHGADDRLGGWTPIWVVCVDGQVYVRTWYRRTTGWYGQVTRTGRARVRIPGIQTDVIVTNIGDNDPRVREAVDTAYGMKYGTPGDATVAGMTTSASAATTLRLAATPDTTGT